MTYFKDLEALEAHIESTQKGSLLITYRNLPDYAGMVLGIGIIFDVPAKKYQLDLEWISFGLDLYAENLLVGYLYQFDSLKNLAGYLQVTFQIAITEIPVKYKIDSELFPNPFKDAGREKEFEDCWQRFVGDFNTGMYVDHSLELVYTSKWT